MADKVRSPAFRATQTFNLELLTTEWKICKYEPHSFGYLVPFWTLVMQDEKNWDRLKRLVQDISPKAREARTDGR